MPCICSAVIAHQIGDDKTAVDLIRKAIALQPKAPAFHRNIGVALLALGETDRAVEHHRTAIRLNPNYAEAHHSLGEALRRRSEHDDAIESYRAAIALMPDLASAYNGMGVAFAQKGMHEKAAAQYRRALEIRPDFTQAHINLANQLRILGRPDEADSQFRRALEIQPDSIPAHTNLGNLLKDRGRVSEAIACYERVLELAPEFAPAHNNLANCLKDQGKIEQALGHFRDAIRLGPSLMDVHSNLLLTLHYAPGPTAEEIFAEHLAWARGRAAPLAAALEDHPNDTAPERQLRIGYVSPDLRRHPVASFLEPILANHDRDAFEVYCYSNVESVDHVTERLNRLVAVWRDLRGLTDDVAAVRIREDVIDILVDLAGHTARNRMGLFARKPAPLQVSYIGYPNTTGLETMDYRITDSWVDPPGNADALHTESLVRLPAGFTCFMPSPDAPPVVRPPAQNSGHATFASFNQPDGEGQSDADRTLVGNPPSRRGRQVDHQGTPARGRGHADIPSQPVR